MSEDYVPVYDEDGNLKHYQSTDLVFDSIEASSEFTDPGGTTHTGGLGGVNLGVLARYTSNSTHSGSYNGLVLTDGSNLTLSSSEPSDGDFLVIVNFGEFSAVLSDDAGAPIRHEGYSLSNPSVNAGMMAWLVWNETEGWWEASGDFMYSP